VLVSVEKVVLGLGLVALGAVWTLGNLGRLDALETLHRWWPLLLVVWGALEIVVSVSRRSAARRTP
jgi:cell wall-active antibiotic response 4TMS protein YvqF